MATKNAIMSPLIMVPKTVPDVKLFTIANAASIITKKTENTRIKILVAHGFL